MESQSQTQLSAHASPSGDVDLAGFFWGGCSSWGDLITPPAALVQGSAVVSRLSVSEKHASIITYLFFFKHIIYLYAFASLVGPQNTGR